MNSAPLLPADATAATELTLLNGDVGPMEPGRSATPVDCITPNWRESASLRPGRSGPSLTRPTDNEISRTLVNKGSIWRPRRTKLRHDGRQSHDRFLASHLTSSRSFERGSESEPSLDDFKQDTFSTFINTRFRNADVGAFSVYTFLHLGYLRLCGWTRRHFRRFFFQLIFQARIIFRCTFLSNFWAERLGLNS